METGSLCWSGRIQLANPACNFDLTIVGVFFGRDALPRLKLAPPFRQMRIQSSQAFASHIFYRLAELFRAFPRPTLLAA
jgi:hypothetical protein